MLSRLTCDLCGEPALAVDPGSEPQRQVAILIGAGAPMRCWCLAHWVEALR